MLGVVFFVFAAEVVDGLCSAGGRVVELGHNRIVSMAGTRQSGCERGRLSTVGMVDNTGKLWITRQKELG